MSKTTTTSPRLSPRRISSNAALVTRPNSRLVGQMTWRAYSRVTGKPEVSLAWRFQGKALIELANTAAYGIPKL
jgi:hypothetical protein